MKYRTAGLLAILMLLCSRSHAQFPWQKPVKRDPADVHRIVGRIEQREPSRDLTIVWVWGIDKLHEKGTHEYAWVMDRYVNELDKGVVGKCRSCGLLLVAEAEVGL